MTDTSGSAESPASTVFNASLSLVAILVGVIAVFMGEIGELDAKGLSQFANNTRILLYVVTGFILVCCWSAFWSFIAIFTKYDYRKIYTIPLLLCIIAIFLFIPFWVWSNS